MSDTHRAGYVALVGRPNVGKSTLLNRMLDHKLSIVTAAPQTTRRRILGVARRPDAELALVDTPGIHKPQHRMNTAMVRDATDALRSAELILFVLDAADKRGPGEDFILSLLAEAGTPAILALNKIDLLKKEALLPLIADLSKRHAFHAIVPVSARTGENVERLFEVLAASLPEGQAAYPADFLTATPETEWIAEVIREKLLERTRDELPFAPLAAVREAIAEAQRIRGVHRDAACAVRVQRSPH